jgi:signal peptidase I
MNKFNIFKTIIFKRIDTLLIMGMLLFCVLAVFVFNRTMVEGISMENSYKSQDVLITALLYTEIKRGDVVVFYSDNQDGKSFLPNMFSTLWQTRTNGNSTRDIFVKRVVAVAGDNVELKNKKLYINDLQVEENYTKNDWICNQESSRLPIDYKKTSVPEASFFVMGDNRGCSQDSRELGPISKKAIVGKVIYKF